MLRPALLAGAALALLATAAFAQTADRRGAATESHADHAQEIVVTAFKRSREELLTGASVVSGPELVRELRPTIGETLARQPGVSATSFGPNASRPVLRGFQGERIRVLTDGIGSLDASNTSVDHAVAINPLTAERIEVLRGPSALLFGSSAIGGVVNVIDARIPRRIPDEPAHFDAILTYGSAADERSVNATVDAPLSGGFVLHLDGNYTRSDDLRIGGFVLAPELRAEAASSADVGIRELASLKGRLPNTASETSDVAAGAAYIGNGGNFGLSVNRYDSRYGVPVRHALTPSEEEEAARIDVKQTRADLRAEVEAGAGFLDSLRARAGYSDYRHHELEETGEVGTRFLSEGFEARVEAVQAERAGFGGGFGLQYFRRSVDVAGEEKFLPENETEQAGIFGLQTLTRGRFRGEVGLRYERQTVSAEADPDLGNPRLKRSFASFSGSIGGSMELADDVRLGLNLSHAQRAPSAEELFANGPHAGTQAFQVGDPDLDGEKSWGLEATLSAGGDGFNVRAALFRSWFDNYIFDQPTGAVLDDLPVFQTRQASARYSGLELEGSARLGTIGGVAVSVDALADYVRATIDSQGPAPRIPPLRLLGGVEAQAERIQARIEVEWTDEQERLAAFETPTDGFTTVNASVTLQPFRNRRNASLSVSANNILDVEARRHASVLKDFAPLAGRDIRLSARLSF